MALKITTGRTDINSDTFKFLPSRARGEFLKLECFLVKYGIRSRFFCRRIIPLLNYFIAKDGLLLQLKSFKTSVSWTLQENRG